MYEVKVLNKNEWPFVYACEQEIGMQAGLIGHLRADNDSNGLGFYSSWFDFCDDYKTEEFKAEFDSLINHFRFEAEEPFLSNRTEMTQYCKKHPDSESGQEQVWYGFRIDTESHSYLLRLNPIKGDYNLYCYCYVKDMLDAYMKEAEQGEGKEETR